MLSIVSDSFGLKEERIKQNKRNKKVIYKDKYIKKRPSASETRKLRVPYQI